MCQTELYETQAKPHSKWVRVLKLKKYIAKFVTKCLLYLCIAIEPQVWRDGPPLSRVPSHGTPASTGVAIV